MTVHHLPTSPRPVKFTSDDFLLLFEAGAFNDYAKAELIDGEVLVVNAAFSRHAFMQRALFLALHEACRAGPPGLEAFFEYTVKLPPRTVVVPDLVVARDLPREGPMPIGSLLIAIEVAHTTLDFDLDIKTSLYAREGVPEYWVANIEGACLHQFWHPTHDGYAEQRQHPFGGRVEAATLPIGIDLPDA